MDSRTWHEAGLLPFGTVTEWINEHLGRLEAEELAIFASEPEGSGSEDDPERASRILIATDVGLFDFSWRRPDEVEDRALEGVHIPWSDVSGLRLRGRTELAPTLMHEPPRWRLEIAHPPVILEASAEEREALLEFWQECRKQLGKAGGSG